MISAGQASNETVPCTAAWFGTTVVFTGVASLVFVSPPASPIPFKIELRIPLPASSPDL